MRKGAMSVDGIVVSVISGNNSAGVSILKVSGYLDTTTAGELENALYGLLDRNLFKIVVDLSGVNYISSAGWGIFIGEIRRIRNHGGDLKLSGMIGDVHEVFQLLEFHSILEAYPTTPEAVGAFKVTDPTP
jgi:anti-sigma B factor antagonist